MAEITCPKAETCARLHRLGTHACSNCSCKSIDDSSNEETADNESEEVEHDDYGNEGSHLFRVRLTKTEYCECYIDIAADSEEEALDRADSLDDDFEWECEDCDYDYPTIDETLS